jgi:hypothetical protein
MATNTQLLARRLGDLVEANDRLCDVLVRQRALMAKAATNIETAGLTVGGLLSRDAAKLRGELTNALDEFERTRHMVRLSLFAVLGLDQGETVAEIARTLGISRQLASRLARESADEA